MRIDGYRLVERIGSGGMGTVYRAEADGQTFAVKILHDHLQAEPQYVHRFEREVTAGRQVDHPNVVRTIGGGVCDEGGVRHLYLVMDYVDGRTLADLLRELGTIPETMLREIARQVALGLEAMHTCGIVHRDLKPANLILSNDDTVKVMDLGLAKLDAMSKLSSTGQFVGSILYAAPEQFQSERALLDGRTDLFALGAVLHELLTGVHPFRHPDIARVIDLIVDENPRPVRDLAPEVSPFFAEVVRRLLEKSPSDRFSSARAVVEALDEGESADWWQHRAGTDAAWPPRRPPVPRETTVHGREDELAWLHSVYETVRNGSGRVILLEGEAGVGKTRLVDEIVERLADAGERFDFLFGAFAPGGGSGLSAFLGAFRARLEAEGLDATARRLLADAPALAPRFAALLRGEPPRRGEKPLAKDSILTAFVDALRALAAERPAILVIDDLHFAPDEARALFNGLALAVAGDRVLLVGTTRPGPAEWTADLARLDHAEHRALERLSGDAVERIVEERLASESLATRVGRRVAEKSDGNPYFALQILGRLAERREQVSGPDDVIVPDTVTQLIRSKLAELEDDEREALDVAACCGYEFDPDLVAVALGRPRIPTLRRFGTVERRHRLIHSFGRHFRFDHHQVHETLYETLPERLREAYHGEIASALAARVVGEPEGAVASDLCEHLVLASAARDALPYAQSALRYLGATYQNERIVALTGRLLETGSSTDPDLTTRLWLERALVLSRLGRRDEATEAFEQAARAADSASDKTLEVHVRLGTGQHVLASGDQERAEREIRGALGRATELGYGELAAEAQIALGRGLLTVGRLDEAIDELGKAKERSEAANLDRLAWLAATELGLAHFYRGEFEAARRLLEPALAAFLREGDNQHVGRAASILGAVQFELGQLGDALTLHEQHLATARQTGSRRSEGVATSNRASVLRQLGRYDEARRAFERAREIARETGDPFDEAAALANLGMIDATTGAAQSAVEHLERALQLCGALQDDATRITVLTWLGRVLAGSEEGARRYFEDALATARGQDRKLAMAEILIEIARLDLDAGDRSVASEKLDEAVALATEIGAPAARTLASVTRARLSEDLVPPAVAALEEQRERLDPYTRMDAEFTLWRATGDPESLERAHSILESIRRAAPERPSGRRLAATLHEQIDEARNRSRSGPETGKEGENGN